MRVLLNHAFDIETYSIHGDAQGVGGDAATANFVGHRALPETLSVDEARRSEQLYMIKTHAYPLNETDKAIYLIRDGRECAVSYWHYLNDYVSGDFSLNDVILGNVPFGRWGDHVNAWKPAQCKNTLLVKFENITNDPVPYISLISNFIDRNFTNTEIPDFSQLHEINPHFFRSGSVDSWKQEMDETQQLVFWSLNFKQMSSFYSDKEYPIILRDLSVQKVCDAFQPLITELCKNVDEAKSELKASKNLVGEIKRTVKSLNSTSTITSPLEKLFHYRKLLRLVRQQAMNTD